MRALLPARMLFLLLLFAGTLFARTAHEAWREGAALYVEEQDERALAVVEQGLAQFPGDRKLEMLKTLLEERKQQNQQNQNQQNQNQQNQDQQNQDKNDQDKQNEQGGNEGSSQGQSSQDGNSQAGSSEGGSSDGQGDRDGRSSGASSSSAGGAGQGGEGSSSSQGEEPEPQAADGRPEQTPPPGQEMTEEQARQLLESFADEDRKKKGKPRKGIRVPGGKDW